MYGRWHGPMADVHVIDSTTLPRPGLVPEEQEACEPGYAPRCGSASGSPEHGYSGHTAHRSSPYHKYHNLCPHTARRESSDVLSLSTSGVSRLSPPSLRSGSGLRAVHLTYARTCAPWRSRSRADALRRLGPRSERRGLVSLFHQDFTVSMRHSTQRAQSAFFGV